MSVVCNMCNNVPGWKTDYLKLHRKPEQYYYLIKTENTLIKIVEIPFHA